MNDELATPTEHIVHYRIREICTIAGTEEQFIVELIEHGIIEPNGKQRSDWTFSWQQAQRCKSAQRLRNDLGINVEGIGLSLQLLEEVDSLRKQLAMLERR